MAITTNTNPPVPGTTTQTWEGYVRADEVLRGDRLIGEHNGVVGGATSYSQAGNDYTMITTFRLVSESYHADETLYIERTVTVTVEVAS